MCSSFAQIGAKGRFSSNSKALPINKLASRPQTSSGWVSNRSGPG